MNWCLVNEDGLVINVIIYDGISPYTPPQGTSLIQSDIAGIGWTYTNGQFNNPNLGQ